MVKKRFCPNCGSKDVEPDFSDAAYIGMAGGNPNAWKCSNCEFNGLMPEIENGEEPSFEDKEAEEQDLEDVSFDPEDDYRRFSTGFGDAELKFYIYVMIPAALLYVLYLLVLG